MTASSLGRKQCQVRLTLATQHGQVDLDTADAARLRERDRPRLDRLRGKDPAAARLRRVLADEAEVARELLDRVDRPDALDLDGDPFAGRVLAHEIDGADLGWPLALHEGELLAERRWRRRELELQVALDAVLLQRSRLAHVVHDVAQHFREADLEDVVCLWLANDEAVSLVLDHGRRRHPVERLEAAGVVVHEDGSVRLEDEEPDRLRQNGTQTAGIPDLAAGDEQAHTGNLLSVPDRSRSGAAGPAGWVARLTTNCRECGRRRRLQRG